jgi:signal transduction histidine kinase/ligand-binding sensor domain-containing protein
MRLFLLFLSLFWLFVAANGQTVDLRFVDFKHNSRLSSTYVNDIEQDELGFIWLGTLNGLQRFDGNVFKDYLIGSNVSFGIEESAVNKIFADKNGYLWLGMNSHLCRYDYRTDSIIIVADEQSTNGLESAYVENFLNGSDSAFYVAQGSSLYLFDYGDSSFEQIFSLPKGEISSFCFSNDTTLLISTFSQQLLYQFNVFTKEYSAFNIKNEYTKGYNIVDIVYYDNKVWVAADGAGVFNVDIKTGEYRTYQAENEYALNIKNFYIDRDSFLWLIDFTGLKLYIQDRDFFQGYYADDSDNYSVAPNINRIFQDRDNNYWTSHYPGGIGFSPYPKGFTRFDALINSPFRLSENNISAITEDQHGNLYMGNPHNGIDVFLWEEGRALSLKHQPGSSDGLGKGAVLDLFTDSNERIWVGTYWGGLQEYFPETQTFKSYLHEPDNPFSISSNDVRAIHEDDSGYLWVCTHGKGLCRFDPDNETFKSFNEANNELANDYTFNVLCASDGSVWVATSWGLSHLKKGKEKFINYRYRLGDSTSVSSNMIYTVFEDRAKRIWVGTNKGLNLYQPETDDFKRISGSFNNQNFVSIIDDNDTTLWLGTYNGLSRYYPQNGKVNNFTKEDGLTSNDFIQRAVFNNGKNTLFFGTLHGITYFNPEELKFNKTEPDIYFTSFKIFGEEKTCHNYKRLKQNIVVADKIEFDYSDKVFTIGFSALSYPAAGKNQFAYYLEGFESNWNYVGNQQTATYTNLNPGKYTFRVKAANSEGLWNEAGNSIDIVIIPPFWLTWWFAIIVLALLFFVIILIIKIRERNFIRQNILLEKKIDSRTREIYTQNKLLKSQKVELEKANQMKNNFFRIIAHDLRSPVSSVVQLTSLLEEKSNNLPLEDDKIIKAIGFTAQNMYQMLEEMLLWGRNQMGSMNLQPKKINIYETLVLSFENLTDVAQIKSITLKNNILPDCYVLADMDALKIVLRNILSNAIKFSHTNSYVEAFLEVVNDFVVISITDEGIGMEKSKSNTLFSNTINQSSRGTKGEKGTGLGLLIVKEIVDNMNGEIWVESEIGKGTTFYIKLPKAEE